jgi:hypothetical protein
MGDAIGRGIEAGDSFQTTAKVVQEVVCTPARAQLIANTEYGRAMSAAAMDTYVESGVETVDWLAEESACEVCDDNRVGSPYSLDDAPEQPAHPSCFPAGTLVSGPRVVATTTRRYQGDLVTIVCEGGNEVTVTPHHPILTPTGWVAAGLLQEGDDVLRALDPERIAPSVDPDHCQVVARIEDVARASREACGMATRHVPSAAEDFHGDGTAGEYVEVVTPAGSAKLYGDAARAEHVGHVGLVDAECSPALGLRQPRTLGVANDSTARRHVGSLGEFAAFADRHLGHSCVHRVAAVSCVHSSLGQHAVDRVAVNAVAYRECLDGLAVEVIGDETGRHGMAPVMARDTANAERAVEVGAADAGNGADLVRRLAGLVERDRVIEVRRAVESATHVYNLETVEGWYCANGMIAHNCRCALSPHV